MKVTILDHTNDPEVLIGQMAAIYAKASELVEYNPESGLFTWKERSDVKRPASWNAQNAGNVAGNLNKKLSYVQIRFSVLGANKLLYAHRLAMYMSTGIVPALEVDHIDGDKSNNRLCNLREVTNSINHRNSKKKVTNTSGVTGVCFDVKRGFWYARCKANGKSAFVGNYTNKQDADTAIQLFRANHGYTDRHGKEMQA